MGLTEPSGCSCPSVALSPSMLASQYTRKGRGAVFHRVPIGEDQNRWSGELCERVTHDGFQGRRKQNFDAQLEEGCDWSNPFGHISREFRLYERSCGRDRSCFRSRGMGTRVKANFFLCVRAHTRGRHGVTQMASVAPSRVFEGESFCICVAAREESTNGPDVGRQN